MPASYPFRLWTRLLMAAGLVDKNTAWRGIAPQCPKFGQPLAWPDRQNRSSAMPTVNPSQARPEYFPLAGRLVQRARFQLSIKTRQALFDELALFSAHHRYKTPEIMQIPVTGGSAGYLQWLDDATQN
jgi:uncharacterized protein involved in tolerance to divalent cations